MSTFTTTTRLWHTLRRFPWLVASPVIVVFLFLIGFGWWQYQLTEQYQQEVATLHEEQLLSSEESSALRTDQIAAKEYQQQLEAALKEATSSAKLEESAKVNELYATFKEVNEKLARNQEVNLSGFDKDAALNEWGKLLLNQEYDKLASAMSDAKKSLDESYATYQQSLVKITPAPPAGGESEGGSSNPEGYSNTQVATSRGSFWAKVIKLPLSQVKVKTVSATDNDCTDVPCGSKTLAQYVSELGGFAGMNGSYFCPPDYAHCAGKAYSYNFAVYNSPTGNWVNQNALGWDALIGLAVFNGGSASFYQHPNQWSRGAVTAGITNSPGLLVHNGAVVMDDSKLDIYQKAKGVRGAIGVGGGNIFLAVVSSASLTDAAHVMKSVGANDALNLDGGGSTALYMNGQYFAGPGRLLPNAVVLTR